MSSGNRLALLLPDLGGGGAERVALILAQDWVQGGHQVDLLLLREQGELLPLLPPEVRVINLSASRIRSALRPLIAYLREFQPDAIQISMWPLTVLGIIAHRLARSRARLVISEHIALSKQYGAGRINRLFLRKSIAVFYPLADARVAVSKGVADDLARLSGIDRCSITVIYNPVPQFNPPSDAVDCEALWGDTKFRVLTVGRLNPQKNHRLLIQAMARIPRKIGARLMIVGGGGLDGELRSVAENMGIACEVIFRPFDLDPAPYYRSADLFVLSSNYEGFGLVLVEALCSGLPIVSTDCESGPREILKDGEFGTLVPCGDAGALAAAIEAELDAPVDRDRLVERGRLFSGKDSAGRYLKLMTR